MTTILILTDYYLPGFKAGGPIRSLVNLTDTLGGEFEFFLLTPDHEWGETKPFAAIQYGQWQRVRNAQVRYFTNTEWRRMQWWHVVRKIDYDLLYLTGFFPQTSQAVLWLRWLKLLPAKPVILAPRGEFSTGALLFKAYKKMPYLWLTRQLKLSDGIIWQATSALERDDIVRQLHVTPSEVRIAPNLPSPAGETFAAYQMIDKQPGKLAIIFLSRIVRKKNLDFALRVLAGVQGQVEFNIFGSQEDGDYWQECQQLIANLPDNVTVRYGGELAPDKVDDMLRQHHILFLPTHAENFGHIIIEAMNAGRPVLISDTTPWQNLQDKMAGVVLPLAQPAQFQAALNRWIEMDNPEYQQWAWGAWNYGREFTNDPRLVDANRQLFLDAIAAHTQHR